MKLLKYSRIVLIFAILALTAPKCFANENIFNKARSFQRNGQYTEAINAYKEYLYRPAVKEDLKGKDLEMYTEALIQLMNTYQSVGKPEECI